MCCFAGDTEIKLANGQVKLIKDLREGDIVKGKQTSNKVTKKLSPFLHFRKKYSINGGEYFTTAEHPFMTTTGWKAIKPYKRWWDPECWGNWFHHHKDLKDIKPLSVGDKILTEQGQIQVKSIHGHWNLFNWFDSVYNIRLDNDNTYYANGFLVHNKGGGGGGFVGKIFKKIIDFVTGIVSVFKSPFGANFNSPDFNSTSSEGIQGVLVNKDSAIANIPVVYGTRMVGGIRVYVSTKSSIPANNEFLYVAFVLAEGQCNGYTSLLIDDVVVPLTSYAHGVEATASSGAYSTENRLSVQFFDGRDDQVASTLLKDSSANWTNDHRLRGVCYIACRFRWKKIETNDDANNNPYAGLPQIKVILQGKKIYDSTTGYTAQTVGTITAFSPGTYFNALANENTYLSQQITLTNQNTNFSHDQGTNVSFTLTAQTDVILTNSVDLTLITTEGDLDRLGAAINKLVVVQRLNENGSYVTVNEGAFTIEGSVSAVRNADRLPATTTRTFVKNKTYNLTPGTYRVFYQRNQVRTFGGQYYTVNFKNSIQIVIPEINTARATAYASETVAFNNNPVNVLLDYMRNPRYGKGLTNDSIAWGSFVTAARLCDQVVAYTSSTTGKAFTCDAVLDTGSSLMDNIKQILSGFRGMLPYQQGKFVCKIEHGGDDTSITATPTLPATVFTATPENIIGGVTIDGDSKQTRCNRCRVTYIDPLADYQPNEVIFPDDGSADDIAFLAADGVRLEKNVTLATVANREQALQYAEVFVRRSRNAKIISFATNLSGANASVGDLVRVVNPVIGLDGVIRVSDVRINAEGDIEITGYEHQSSAYAIQAKANDIERPTLSLPNPLLVVAPTAVTATSGAAQNVATGGGYLETDGTLRRILVTWTASTDPFVSEYIIQFKLQADADYVTAGITNLTTFFIQPVTLGSVYNIRVAARNELDRRSNFASAAAHTVIA